MIKWLQSADKLSRSFYRHDKGAPVFSIGETVCVLYELLRESQFSLSSNYIRWASSLYKTFTMNGW